MFGVQPHSSPLREVRRGVPRRWKSHARNGSAFPPGSSGGARRRRRRRDGQLHPSSKPLSTTEPRCSTRPLPQARSRRPDGVVRFTHPLLASAAYPAIPASWARDAPRGWTAAPTRRTASRHFALATSSAIRTQRSIRRGSGACTVTWRADAAATFARHAIRLTPPVDGTALDDRRIALATYLIDARQIATAKSAARELLAGEIFRSPPRGRFSSRSSLNRTSRSPTGSRRRQWRPQATTSRYACTPSWSSAPIRCPAATLWAANASRVRPSPSPKSWATPCCSRGPRMCRAFRGDPAATRSRRCWSERSPCREAMHRSSWVFLRPRVVLGEQRLLAGDLRAPARCSRPSRAGSRLGRESMPPACPLEPDPLEWREGNWKRAERLIGRALAARLRRRGPVRRSKCPLVAKRARGRAWPGDEARELAHETVRRRGVPLAVAGRPRPVGARVHRALAERARRSLGGTSCALPERLEVSRADANRARRQSFPTLSKRPGGGQLDDAEAVLGVFEARARPGDHRWATPRGIALPSAAPAGPRRNRRGTYDRRGGSRRLRGCAGFLLDQGRARLAAGEACAGSASAGAPRSSRPQRRSSRSRRRRLAGASGEMSCAAPGHVRGTTGI